MLDPFVYTASTIISLYSFVVIAAVVLQLLISFNIVNRSQPLVYQINHALRKLTEPVFAPIRKRLPDLGGIDVSPVVVLIGLQFLDMCLRHYLLHL